MVYRLLLDTNIFRLLCANQHAYENWFRAVRKHFHGRRFHITTTPFSVLEGVGVKAPLFIDAELKDKFNSQKDLKVEDVKNEIFSRALNYYENLEEVSQNFLLQEMEIRARHFTGKQKSFFCETMSYALQNPNFVQAIHIHLSMDQVYKFPLSNNLNEDRYHSSMIDIYRAYHECANISQYRAIESQWFSFTRRHVIKAWPHLRDLVHKFNEGFQTSQKKDYLDTEIVSLSCSGFRNRDGQADKVFAFTCDPFQDVLKRCAIYMFFIKNTGEMIRQGAFELGKPIPFEIRNAVPGNIIFCSSNGCIQSMYKTKHLPRRMIPFLKPNSLP